MSYRKHFSSQTQFFHSPHPFRLESGAVLPEVDVGYRTWGSLNAKRDNAVLVCHALTGWADLDQWWGGLLGEGRSLDPSTDFIICSNVLGSCYGTTGPTSRNPATGRMYQSSFPRITIRDMVNLQAMLLESLGVQTLKLVIGGSLGGMQVLEWAVLYPERVEAIAPIAISGRHSAWCIGLGEAQRQAIFADPNWQNGYYRTEDPPLQGLAVARMMAMTTYRSWDNFQQRFGREKRDGYPDKPFAVTTYLHHQGEKLVNRFDANTYVTLTYAMDSHDVSRGRGEYHAILHSIHQPALIVAIDSDVLYPPNEQEELARYLPNARLEWLRSPHGHDAFLIDMDDLNRLVLNFRQELQIRGAMKPTPSIRSFSRLDFA